MILMIQINIFLHKIKIGSILTQLTINGHSPISFPNKCTSFSTKGQYGLVASTCINSVCREVKGVFSDKAALSASYMSLSLSSDLIYFHAQLFFSSLCNLTT